MFSACWRSPVRSMISRRNRSISSAAMSRNLSSSASPDSSCSLSISSVRGRGKRIAVLVEVAEQRQAAIFKRGRAVLVLPVKAGDVVVDQLRCGRVVADDDEAGRNPDAVLAPQRRRSFRSGRRGLPARSAAATGRLSGSSASALPRPFLGIFVRMCSHRLRNIGISPPGMLSATGTRGSLTMPHSMASISEKSLIVHGNSVPSA